MCNTGNQQEMISFILVSMSKCSLESIIKVDEVKYSSINNSMFLLHKDHLTSKALLADYIIIDIDRMLDILKSSKSDSYVLLHADMLGKISKIDKKHYLEKSEKDSIEHDNILSSVFAKLAMT